jgi:[ribosomal protein S5]-alanine N-acetyltransferase
METKEDKVIAKYMDVTLRQLRPDDAPHMARLADNVNVSMNLRDGFPSPYTLQDAENFINLIIEKDFPQILAIDFRGEYAGNISFTPGTNVYRRSAEIGYFIGEPFWNKGIATTAVKLLTRWVFENTTIIRLYAGVFSFNLSSQRVLEKCGYNKEAILEKAVFKKGKFYDEIRYAIIDSANIKEEFLG